MTWSGPWSAQYIEKQYALWKENPERLEKDWRFFFEGFELGLSPPEFFQEGVCDEATARLQSKVEALIYRYRDIGHLMSCLDPLESCPTDHPLLNVEAFGLSTDDLNRPFYAPDLYPDGSVPLKEIIGRLKKTYCRSVGVEYMHIQDPQEREWLQSRIENPDPAGAGAEEKIWIFKKLSQANRFEQFVHKKYLGQKRFSLEGADAVLPMVHELFNHAAGYGCERVILGMSHRGRLNVQVNVFGKSYEDLFREFEDQHNPEGEVGTGDVKYHKGFESTFIAASGEKIHAVMVDNPSHLESVDPVAQGIARAFQDRLTEKNGGAEQIRQKVMPVLLHGDAGFAGQGIVAETLNLSQLSGYATGGTVHIIINNQIGYTTLPEDARSSRYSTDMAKALMIPIFHVHGEDPEAVLRVVRLACDYRMHFGKDVVIDVVCYRRYGHNEGDEPYFTQPTLYERIRNRPTLDRLYAETLVQANVVENDAVENIQNDIDHCLDTALEKARNQPPPSSGKTPDEAADAESADRLDGRTAVAKKELTALAEKINSVPDGFHLHAKLKRVLLDNRLKAVKEGKGIDWANAEALAFATLLKEGRPVRLSGQDSQRGTFSQRHSVLFDTQTGDPYVPLAHIGEDQGPFYTVNSPLSEAGVMGFDYGYSLYRREGLTLWEAQFGDFVNNAQAIIDQYLSSGESKWQKKSGLTLLLPHGYEGMGPEHSSARIERFLQLAAEDNIIVCNPSTPAQYFHLLRRQAVYEISKPLVIFTPKSLLRNPLATSGLADFTREKFSPVIDDPAPPETPRKCVFVSGKLYYDLIKAANDQKTKRAALVRVEQLYPFPEKEISKILKKYTACKEFIWAQEEPENQGPWRYMAAIGSSRRFP